MFDDLFGLAQSGYGVLRTVDGGRTWSEPPSRPLIGYGVIGFADRDHAWITGISGIWRTDDAGLNWRRQAGGAGSRSASIAVISADEAWITGGTWSRGAHRGPAGRPHRHRCVRWHCLVAASASLIRPARAWPAHRSESVDRDSDWPYAGRDGRTAESS